MKALRPLFLIIFFVFVSVWMFGYSLRLHGLGKERPVRQHPLLEPDFIKVAYPRSLQEFKDVSRSDYWIKIDLLFSEDSKSKPNEEKRLLVSSLSTPDNEVTLSDIKPDEFLNPVLIDLKESSAEALNRVLKFIEDHKLVQRVSLTSDFSGPIREARTLKPELLTASARDEVQRSFLTAQLYLEPLDPMPGDYFLVPVQGVPFSLLSERVLGELRRRNKKVIVGPIEDEKEIKKYLDRGVNGIITSFPARLEEALKTSQ